MISDTRNLDLPARAIAIIDCLGAAVAELTVTVTELRGNLSTGLEPSVKHSSDTPLTRDEMLAAHRREHRMGRPAKIYVDSELQAFVTARVDTMTFDQIAMEVAAHFAPPRRASRSSIHRWWQKTRAF